ncbi:MAG: GNAT family N-acetyltransferase [Candidatus Odinarchaeota archaeon]
MSKLEVPYRITERQAKSAAKTLARAFHDYPIHIYLFPDEDKRSRKVPILMEYLVRYGIIYGEVYGSSPNLEGVAIWLPFWDAEMTEERFIKCRMSYRDGRELLSVVDEGFSKNFEPIEQCDYRCHKQYADFFNWYLYPIGVDPDHQGSGYAGILLRSKFEEIDKQDIPCYLETHKEKNVSLYQHFGYKTVETGIIRGTDLTFWAMLRKKD